MKQLIIILSVIHISTQAFSQRRRSSAGEAGVTEWKVSKDVVTSGDTIVFTFTNNNYPKFYCYTGSEFYTLYKIVNKREVLAEDTTFRGLRKPVAFVTGDKLTVKKLITKPGSYVIEYPVFFDTNQPPGQKRRLDMKQYFTVEKKL